ncbi:MAG: alanine dehydrogenase [Candidatus Nanohaloarchaea archaeon]|nr:alanine dehydrogenase [Candidatus Nanohaloarchaea archaeon]
MLIGVPQERKDNENRVGMTPAGVQKLVSNGHTVRIEEGAGRGSGISDDAYRQAGAEFVGQDDSWDVDMVVKVKEPLESEYGYLDDQLIFTYFHLAAFPDLTEKLLDTDVTAVAYETVEEGGDLPLLRPMSQVAGRMAPLMGAYYQTRHNNGRGVLPPGMPGVEPADVTVVGGGTVGKNAAEVAAGMGADVTVLEIDQARMEHLEDVLPANVDTVLSNEVNIEKHVTGSDIVVGAVLVPGAAAPEVVTEDHVRGMDDGSVIVDVAVDQGGCVATTRPTHHSDPTYVEHGVVHYAVTNMPGAYARTATYGLTNATIDYAVELADKGWKQACQDNPALRKGLNVAGGRVTEQPVAEEFGMDYTPPEDLL